MIARMAWMFFGRLRMFAFPAILFSRFVALLACFSGLFFRAFWGIPSPIRIAAFIFDVALVRVVALRGVRPFLLVVFLLLVPRGCGGRFTLRFRQGDALQDLALLRGIGIGQHLHGDVEILFPLWLLCADERREQDANESAQQTTLQQPCGEHEPSLAHDLNACCR